MSACTASVTAVAAPARGRDCRAAARRRERQQGATPPAARRVRGARLPRARLRLLRARRKHRRAAGVEPAPPFRAGGRRDRRARPGGRAAGPGRVQHERPDGGRSRPALRRAGRGVGAVRARRVRAPRRGTCRSATGDGRFSEIIRRPDSWRGAPALDVLRAYEGRAVLAVPGTDAVIPPAVTRGGAGRAGRPRPVHALRTAGRGAPVGAVVPRSCRGPAGVRDRGADRPRRPGMDGDPAWVAKQLPEGRTVADVASPVRAVGAPRCAGSPSTTARTWCCGPS